MLESSETSALGQLNRVLTVPLGGGAKVQQQMDSEWLHMQFPANV